MYLNYYYGTMASGKSATLLMNVHQKEVNGVKCVLLKPSENRDKDQIKSRIGLERECLTFGIETNLNDLLGYMCIHEKINEVYIDECQFLTEKQVEELWNISRFFKLKIHCFGLKTTYKNTLFDGVKKLLVCADSIKELEPKCSCKYCEENATTHLLKIDGKVVLDFPDKFEGDIEGSTRFECVCQGCWEKLINKSKENRVA